MYEIIIVEVGELIQNEHPATHHQNQETEH